MTDFSIIIPVYNVKDYLKQTVGSVTAQNYENIEIILVDDHSTDGSSALCNQLASADKRIKVYHKQKNGYVGAARNDGFRMASGKYIYFLDSDDILCEGVLKKVSRLFQNSPEVIASERHCTRTAKNKLITNRMRKKYFTLKGEIASFSPFVGQSFYLREFLIKNAKPFDEHRMLAEDRKWIVENLAFAEKIETADFPFYYYTQRREGSLLNVIRADMLLYSLGEVQKLYENVFYSGYGEDFRLKRKLADHYLTLASCCSIVRDASLRESLLSEVKKNEYILKSKYCLAHYFMWLEKFLGLTSLLRLCNRIFLNYKTDK